MAKVTLVIEDLGDNTVRMKIESDPPLPEGARDEDVFDTLTSAQKLAFYAYASVSEAIESSGGKERPLGAAAN